MPAPLRTHRIPDETPTLPQPLLPTIVVSSFKGGVWKTSIAVALAERLAFAGLRVLLVTTDQQEDARHRLGIKGADGLLPRVERGKGMITVLGAQGSKATDLLYRSGPEKLKVGAFDLAVVDTPPLEIGGHLPGVLLIVTMDGADAARNATLMLQKTPKNTEIVLIKVQRMDNEEWKNDVDTIATVVGRSDILFLKESLPKAEPIARAHNQMFESAIDSQ